ncbi:MAG: 50S ribosomal protein L10 [Acetobacteraceae bacterium]|nr:50S ribosomal protein L10 [Acetobacteraceae bacterium]
MRTREFKAQWVERVRERLGRARSVVLVDYRGLSVAEISDVRRRLAGADAELHVVKNSVLRLACRDVGLGGLEPHLAGPNALVLGSGDEAAPARVLAQFAAEARKLELKAGVLGGQVLDLAQVKALAALPPRPELVGRLLGGLSAPIVRLTLALGAPLRGLIGALEARRAQLEASAPPA